MELHTKFNAIPLFLLFIYLFINYQNKVTINQVGKNNIHIC